MVSDFIQEYFINPILYQDQYAPYNVYNTAVYAIIALLAVYLIFRGLRKTGVDIDKKFFYAILPFVVFGGIFRVFEDAQILPRVVNLGGLELYPFVTPYIYVLIFLLLAVTAGVWWMATKNKQKTLDGVGKAGTVYAAAAFFVLVPGFKDFVSGFMILGLAALAFGLYWLVNHVRQVPGDALVSFMVFGQVFDGAATFVGTNFAGYAEQHVLGNFLIGAAGPWLFFAIKIGFALVAAEVLRKETAVNERNFVLLLITIFGLAPGTRDLLRIVSGV
ncbi:DUF63 family protein [Candidatus Micrarchaeota archaeon]|nr:DUF63 family protein [Candidatus Micrarchaeota archaeon]